MANIIIPGLPFWTAPEPATDEVQQICNDKKQEIENILGRNSETFVALLHRREIMCGSTNYVVKILIGSKECVHAMLSRMEIEFKTDFTVRAVKADMTRADDLNPFSDGKLCK
ncbi:cystatin-A5 [Octopus bimaculoides]|uniref:Cystatin domain-containing protein n=1 Tax=Octopus bimaculoides TaxID=37653 RepID=A0A0L8G7F8_OCTBM|nr:cystatin-A5 [Octopus bimaculoides]|eukprot:XP_014783688.1 PREDICTED: cystatin-A5-like [Octopus bimaculoides]